MPDKVWNLHEAEEKIEVNLGIMAKPEEENNSWWHQTVLQHLDLSSNVLINISSEIGNLYDLTILDVSTYLIITLIISINFFYIKKCNYIAS